MKIQSDILVRVREVHKRTAYSSDIRELDASDMENFAMTTYDANEAMREFLGPRADDLVMKNEMYAEISRKGYVNLDDLTSDVSNKKTINTLDVYFICMGIKTNLITDGYLLKKSLD